MNRIKEVLKDKGISQTWLAEKMEKAILLSMNTQETRDNLV